MDALASRQEDADARQRDADARQRDTDARQRNADARFELLARQLRGEDGPEETLLAGNEATAAGEPPTVKEPAAPAEIRPLDNAAPALATPVQNSGRGRLDSATLQQFLKYGSNDLSCAEDWLAQAEEVGKDCNLSHNQLCTAFYDRCVGEVKAFADLLDDGIKCSWPRLCDALLSNFSRKIRLPMFREELVRMDKIAGLPFQVAIRRVEKLMVATDYPSDDLGPVLTLLKAFPDELRTVAMAKGLLGRTWQDACAYLSEIGSDIAAACPDIQLVARPATKAPPRAPARNPAAVVEPAATTEPAVTPNPVAAVARPVGRKPRGPLICWNCGGEGHTRRQCGKPLSEDKKRPKN
jgi:hypothetical protein